MARVGVIGVYDADPAALVGVDLMRYLGALGHSPDAIVFRGSTSTRAGVPLNTPIPLGEDRTAVHVRDFNDPAAVSAMRALNVDVFVYAGGRDLLRQPVLDAAPRGCIGGHYGQLPAVRGMGTVEWSVLMRVPIVVTIQRLAAGVDLGDVLLQSTVPLRHDDTFASIRERCYFVTKVLLAIVVRGLFDGTVTPTPQDAAVGRQFFRLHPAVLAVAARSLRKQTDRLKPQ